MPLPNFPPNGGTLSSYLIGTWEVNAGLETTIYVVNPTSRLVPYKIVFFDSSGMPITCRRLRVPANGLNALKCSEYVPNGEGVVKIVTFNNDDDNWQTVQPGLVGYQKKILDRWFFWFWRRYAQTEAPLFQIPYEVLKDGEFDIINGLAC